MNYLVKTPWWLRLAYASLQWKMPDEGNNIYLTFDDGPHPVVTPFVLDLLKKYDAKATFFCIGNNVQSYPDIYRSVLDEGHRIGNHSMSHYNGWETEDATYLHDVMAAKKVIDSKLFRPPYGRVTRFQIQQLKQHFNIIMWDVISGDFDVAISGEKCAANVIDNTRPGSIIVFHDSEKAFPRLKYALPKALEYFETKGWKSRAL